MAHLFRILMRLFTLLGRIPRPLARKMGNLLGDAWFRLDGATGRLRWTIWRLPWVANWLRTSATRSPRAVYRNLGQILFEIGWSLAARHWSTLNKSVTIDGLENYQAGREQGNGVLVVTAHLGNWELLSPVLTKPIGLARQHRLPAP
jgi:KDO2-lipid IV(A) lauroyltransferase